MSDVIQLITTLAYVGAGVCVVLTLFVLRCKAAYDAATALFREAGDAYQRGDSVSGETIYALGKRELARADAMFIRRLMRI